MDILSMDINRLLKELGWTQAHAARMFEVSSKTMNRWCNSFAGPPKVYLLYLDLLIKTMGIRVDE